MALEVRRIVTGHDASGRAIVASDQRLPAFTGTTKFHELCTLLPWELPAKRNLARSTSSPRNAQHQSATPANQADVMTLTHNVR